MEKIGHVPQGPLRWLTAAIAAVVTGLLILGIGLAVRGGLSRLVPVTPFARRVESAFVVRELGSGRYLIYTEIQIHPGDLVITPAREVYRIERVDLNTGWARLVGRDGERAR